VEVGAKAEAIAGRAAYMLRPLGRTVRCIVGTTGIIPRRPSVRSRLNREVRFLSHTHLIGGIQLPLAEVIQSAHDEREWL
jgi:hypothetical protein